MAMSRVQWEVDVIDGKYVKNPDDPGSYWVI